MTMNKPSTFSLGGASYFEAPESPVDGRHCAGCAFDKTPNACKAAGPLARDAFGRDCCTAPVIYRRAIDLPAGADLFGICMIVAEAAWKEAAGSQRSVRSDLLKPIVADCLTQLGAHPA